MPRNQAALAVCSHHRQQPQLPDLPQPLSQLIPSRANLVWVWDFTYIRIETGFCYLAAILDAISRRIDTPLALAALRSVVRSRQPQPGCIYYTGRGCQYASETYRRALQEAEPYPHREAFRLTKRVGQYSMAI
jgi:transposase InsO family protein